MSVSSTRTRPTRTRPARTLRARLAALLGLVVLLTGCQGAYDLPLPGGAANGPDVYRVTIDFADVLDLVPQSAVKVNDVTVGAVESVELHDWHARVVVRIEDDVELPDDADATLRQTSLLGEKFVSLSAPASGGVGRLSDGDVIPLDRTGRNPEVEEVLGALSLLLNGGGVAQLQTINRELNDALEGRESDVRDALEQLDVFVTGLDQHKSEIVRAIEAIDRLSATLAAQQQDIATALDTIPGGLRVLADQREQLTAMLTALSDLGVTATRVIDASQADTVANLQALDPVLTQLAAAGDALPESLDVFVSYPFPDVAAEGIKGDYTNLSIRLDANLSDLDSLLPQPTGGPSLPPLPSLPLPSLPIPTDLPTLPLPELCGALGLAGDCQLPPVQQICQDLVGAAACDPVVEICEATGGVLTPGGICQLPPLTEVCRELPVLGQTLCPAGQPTATQTVTAPPSSTTPPPICLPIIGCVGGDRTDASGRSSYDPALAALLLGGV